MAEDEGLAATVRRPGATGVAWQIASGVSAPEQPAPPPAVPKQHAPGGCAFDIDLPRPVPRGGRRPPREKPAPAPPHPAAAKAHAAAERGRGGGAGPAGGREGRRRWARAAAARASAWRRRGGRRPSSRGPRSSRTRRP